MPTNCYVLLLYAYKLLCTSFVRLQIALYFFCTLQVGTSCVMNGFELLCTVLTYPPAWSWVVLPGFSCKPAPPRAGGAVTTGYIFQNDANKLWTVCDVLINPGLRQYKFGHFVLGELSVWLALKHLKYSEPEDSSARSTK